ncbi:MAG: ABC transporter substrate-binding protein [Oscillospiraceae bacterium]
MKKTLAIVLALVMVLALCACGSEPAATGNPVVKIGVFEPASGKNGAGGKQETLGMQYANTVAPTVEIGGKTYDVKLVTVDNESAEDKAPTAAATLVDEKVSIVLGSYGSSVAMAGGPIFEQAGIPCVGVTCTNQLVTEGNTYYFRICFIDPFQGTVLANYAKGEGMKKAYCLSELGDDYSTNLVQCFVDAFEAAGGECVVESFPLDTSDFGSYIANAKKEGCEVFMSPVSTASAQLIIDQSISQGLEMPILAGDTWDSNVILQAAKDKAVDVTVTTFYPEGADAEFDANFKAWLASDSTALSNNGGDDTVAAVTAMGYDAYFFALEALKKAGSVEPADVMAALWDTTLDGVCGPISIEKVNGDAVRNTAYVKHANTETGMWDALPAVTID